MREQRLERGDAERLVRGQVGQRVEPSERPEHVAGRDAVLAQLEAVARGEPRAEHVPVVPAHHLGPRRVDHDRGQLLGALVGREADDAIGDARAGGEGLDARDDVPAVPVRAQPQLGVLRRPGAGPEPPVRGALREQRVALRRLQVVVDAGLEDVVVAEQLRDRAVGAGDASDDVVGGRERRPLPAEVGRNDEVDQPRPAQQVDLRERRRVGGVALGGVAAELERDLVGDGVPAGHVAGDLGLAGQRQERCQHARGRVPFDVDGHAPHSSSRHPEAP